jgi:putative transposase
MGEKKVNGRKRHLLVDVLGLVIVGFVSPANLADPVGGKRLFWRAIAKGLLRLQKVWADSVYDVPWLHKLAKLGGWHLEVLKRTAAVKGFVLVPRRWVVERTFAWLGRYRRLSKEYEVLPQSSEAFIYIAMTRLMLKRLARSAPVSSG